MTIDINEETGITAVFCAIVVASVITALGGCHEMQATEREAIKAGLVQKNVNPTTSATIWTKP